MALGAHEIPVLQQTGPVQDVARVDLLAGIEMEPPLPSLGTRAGIPGDREGLVAAFRKGHQVLLQRVDAEGVGDGELGQAAIRSVGPDPETAVPAEEGGTDSGVVVVSGC